MYMYICIDTHVCMYVFSMNIIVTVSGSDFVIVVVLYFAVKTTVRETRHERHEHEYSLTHARTYTIKNGFHSCTCTLLHIFFMAIPLALAHSRQRCALFCEHHSCVLVFLLASC